MTKKHIFRQLKIKGRPKGLHSFAFYILIFNFSSRSLPTYQVGQRNPRLMNYLRAFGIFTLVKKSLQIGPFCSNKPNFRKSQMYVNKVITTDYEKRTLGQAGKTNPIQSQSNPIQSQSNPIKANKKPKQTQYKPKQSQFQRQKNAAAFDN
ncbi:MAG: hypothetical protein ACYTDW_17260 [Planctomycetota bacterium]|jgi:hypothetical protein